MIPLLDPRYAQWQVSSHPAPSFLHLNLSSVIVTSCPSVAAERRGIWSRNKSRNNGRQVNASKASMASQR
jgi:cytochrome c biogenesis protein ResB